MEALRELVIAVSPCGVLAPSPRVVAAVRRGGGLGVLDLGFGGTPALRAVAEAASSAARPIGIRVTSECQATLDDVDRLGADGIDLIVLTADAPWSVSEASARYRVLVEVTSRTEARRAAGAGGHGLIARGSEAGGRVSRLSAFVLLQQLLSEGLNLPVWAAGGLGPRTAAACVVGGAAGVLLDSQLALMPECDLPDEVNEVVRRMDGTEVVTVGKQRGIYTAPRHRVADLDGARLWPIGEDGQLAAAFAARWPDTAAAVRAVRASIEDALADPTLTDSLLPGAPLATSLGIGIPVAQGPMTRVSDEPTFAAAVAAGGALPFIALALHDGDRCSSILRETAGAMVGRRWGVGILGFVPDELLATQLAAIYEVKPEFAIIAGGRPAQARVLEDHGIATFLHVPSPGLLRQYLRAGSRRFVFEGSECGGHIGPRSSFNLWEAQCAVLLEHLDHNPTAPDIQVFFAGGVHDARSAAMVATVAGDLVRRGVEIGLLMGTAYLFTREAVAHKAIQPLFQRKVLAADETVLLETAPGHVTRCVASQYADEFQRQKAAMEASGTDRRETWERLELLNTGRLRLASRGREHDGAEVDEERQSAEGLYMAGQVAVLRAAPTTIAELHRAVSVEAAGFLSSRIDGWQANSRKEVSTPPAASPRDVAIIGMACMFPGSADLAGYWKLILGADDAITEVPLGRWDPALRYTDAAGVAIGNERVVSRWGGFLGQTSFDPIRFGIPPSALGSIDPGQLLALQTAHHALLDAGYAYDMPGVDHTRTGVVFGAQLGGDVVNATMLRSILPSYFGVVPSEFDEQLPTITEDTFPGILPNVVAGRIANRLNLGGANFTVDAACAASLAAVDVACKELTSGNADLMLCGAVDLHNTISDFVMFGSVRALSPTGRARTFDRDADGTTLGEGVVCVVLKRLANAKRDGDRIYGVIKGVGSASDGRSLGLTAPSAAGQLTALRRAYREAGVSPRSVGLVEAHGTGTVVGDRIELQSLTTMFAESAAQPGRCVLGSVKSQIGHTKVAAGLAGLVKAALAVYTGVQPPTVHLSQPDAGWDPGESPFGFLVRPRPWIAPAGERVAGISAFGFGGTNFHVVLSGHSGTPEPRHASSEWPAELFVFRGGDREMALAPVRALEALLATGDGRPQPAGRLRELAMVNAREPGARTGPVRIAIVARDLDELTVLVRRAIAGEHDPSAGLIQPPTDPWPEPPRVAFVFPGQGSQRPDAMADLFVHFPDLRQFLRDSPEVADRLFPLAAFDSAGIRARSDRVRETTTAQPALGLCGLAAHHLLGQLGIRPDLVAGHSYGELVALSAAGAFDAATFFLSAGSGPTP